MRFIVDFLTFTKHKYTPVFMCGEREQGGIPYDVPNNVYVKYTI